MQNILNILEIVLALLLVFIILIQNKSVTLNLTSMSWGMNQIKKRWPEKVLHVSTVILWILFVLNSIILFIVN